MNKNNYPKVVVLGPSGCGKTTMINRWRGINIQHHEATLGLEVTPINEGNGIRYNVWECAGDPNFYGTNREDYFQGARGAIIIANDDNEYAMFVEQFRRISNAPILRTTNNAPIGILSHF